MKKILYLITQSELGGAQRHIFDLANNLKGEYEVEVAFGEQGELGGLVDLLRKAGIKYHIIPHLKRAISPISDLIAIFEIIKLIRQIKPDIIHLNSSKISILGSIAAKICYMLRVSSYVIYTVHGWVFNEPLPVWQKNFYLFAEKFTARFKDRLICVSEFDRQIAIKYKIAPENKLVTIHNGIAAVEFLSKEDAKTLFREGYKIQDTRYKIVSVGNLYPTKGYQYLIQAVKILSDKNIDFSLTIIGDGPDNENLHKLTGDLGLGDKIIFTGRIENAASLLPAFDLYVSSSVKEGLSYTLIEAMQAGLPIVATRVGGNPELIEGKKNGLVVEAHDTQALADAIITIIENPNLAAQYSASAKTKAQTQFTLAKMLAETKNVYINPL